MFSELDPLFETKNFGFHKYFVVLFCFEAFFFVASRPPDKGEVGGGRGLPTSKELGLSLFEVEVMKKAQLGKKSSGLMYSRDFAPFRKKKKGDNTCSWFVLLACPHMQSAKLAVCMPKATVL